MRRRRLLLLAGVLALLALAGGGLLWLDGQRDRVTPAACASITPGMTEDQVEAVLGRPADGQYHPWNVSPYMPVGAGERVEWEKQWVGEDCLLLVHFDAGGQVLARGWTDKNDVYRPPHGLLDRLRRLLPW